MGEWLCELPFTQILRDRRRYLKFNMKSFLQKYLNLFQVTISGWIDKASNKRKYILIYI